MSPWLVVLLCLAAGVTGLLLGRRLGRSTPAETAAAHVLAPDAKQVALLSGRPVIFVGEHDEVLDATEPARTLGLARGSRVAVPALLDLVRTSRRTDEAMTTSVDLTHGSAVATHLEVTVAPLGPGLVAIVASDTTDARRMDAARRDFVTNISHELKTPIGAIALLNEAIEQAAEDPDTVLHFAGRMQRESARLAELVGQIITVSRLQSHDPLQAARAVDVGLLVRQGVDRNLARAKSRHVHITIHDQAGCEVTGDCDQLTDAVSNLVSNAIAYSDESARVTVASRRLEIDGDDQVEISVTDNGIGIPAAEQDRIFDRFYRVDPDRSRASGGTGLGLSIVKLVAEAHGGSVTVWSKLGQGSTFTLRLPVRLPGTVNERSLEATR